MKLGLLFNFVFSFLFLFHTSVQASVNPYAQVTEKLAAMTDQEKLAQLEKVYSKEELSQFKNAGKIPEVSEKNSVFTLKVEEKILEFKVIKPYLISFKGQEIDVSPGKLTAAIAKLKLLMNQPKATLLDLFISSAHAQVLLVDIILGAIIAIAVVAVMVTMLFHNHPITRMCKEAREKLDLAEGNLTAADYSDIEFSINKNLSDISVASICSDHERKEICSDAKKCLNDLKGEIAQRKKAVNNSERNLLKDYQPPMTKEAWPLEKKKSSKQ